MARSARLFNDRTQKIFTRIDQVGAKGGQRFPFSVFGHQAVVEHCTFIGYVSGYKICYVGSLAPV